MSETPSTTTTENQPLAPAGQGDQKLDALLDRINGLNGEGGGGGALAPVASSSSSAVADSKGPQEELKDGMFFPVRNQASRNWGFLKLLSKN